MPANDTTQLVAEIRGWATDLGFQQVGVAGIDLAADEVHLLNIAVDPAVQGQGCARLLLDTMDHWARLQSAQWLWLEVRESNTRARAIYERHGYRQVGARKRYYPVHHGERETAIIMSMHLYGPEP